MASRREQKERLKAERVERERQARSAERRKRLVGYGAGGVLVAGVVIALVVVISAGGGEGSSGGAALAGGGDFPEGSVPPPPPPGKSLGPQAAARAAGCELQQNPSEGATHTQESVDYERNPPDSGDHAPVAAEDGAYTEQPRTEALVHSQEHGRVVIHFDPEAPDSVKGDLKALFDEDPYHMILTPNETGMAPQVAATTWTRRLACPEVNEKTFDAIRAFRDEFRDEGPEFVP